MTWEEPFDQSGFDFLERDGRGDLRRSVNHCESGNRTAKILRELVGSNRVRNVTRRQLATT
jgi:hypothetical protein